MAEMPARNGAGAPRTIQSSRTTPGTRSGKRRESSNAAQPLWALARDEALDALEVDDADGVVDQAVPRVVVGTRRVGAVAGPVHRDAPPVPGGHLGDGRPDRAIDAEAGGVQQDRFRVIGVRADEVVVDGGRGRLRPGLVRCHGGPVHVLDHQHGAPAVGRATRARRGPLGENPQQLQQRLADQHGRVLAWVHRRGRAGQPVEDGEEGSEPRIVGQGPGPGGGQQRLGYRAEAGPLRLVRAPTDEHHVARSGEGVRHQPGRAAARRPEDRDRAPRAAPGGGERGPRWPISSARPTSA
jgi:hypothetical protein